MSHTASTAAGDDRASGAHTEPSRLPVVLGAVLAVVWTAVAVGGVFLAMILTRFCAFAECSQPNVVLGSTVATSVGLLWFAGVLGIAHLSGLLPRGLLAPAAAAGAGLALLFGSLFAATGRAGNGANYYPRSGDLPEEQLIQLSERMTFGLRTAAVALLVAALVMVWTRAAARTQRQ